MTKRTAGFTLWFFLMAALVGCAQDVGEIDRVQPGALDKKVFEGEWYFQRTVVDVPYTVGYTFIGETEELERVRWEIHEDRLVAYRSYDFIDNTDLSRARRAKPGETVTGQPIASYEIVKHFDIQREYSSTTGEQGNVLLENDSDRPWFERDYIRVNWGANEATSFWFTVDDIPTEPTKFAITDPEDPDAFTMGWRDAAKETGWRETRDTDTHRNAKTADYMDFVTKVVAKPEKFSWWDPWWGPESWPACWFYLNVECKNSEIEIRTSLMRVPDKDAYEALEYPDNYIARDADGKPIRVSERSKLIDAQQDMQISVSEGVIRDPDGHLVRVPMFDKFGFFRTERFGYDKQHGEVESARRYRIARHDIWQASVDADGKTIPYAQRQVRPIVYYLGAGTPKELADAAKAVAKSWDGVFREVVAELQDKAAADVGDVFVLKPNTLKLDENGKVVDRGQRIGDVRFSQMTVIDEPTRAGLLGYGPSNTDPLTGKIISASAHAYGGPLREFATMGRDLIRLARGDIDPVDYGLGNVTSTEVKTMLKPFAPSGQPTSAMPKKAASRQQRLSKAKAFASAHASRSKQKQVHKMKKSSMSAWPNYAQARANLLKGSKWEDRLINREVALAFGTQADGSKAAGMPAGAALGTLSDAQRDRMSPRSWMAFASRVHRREHQRILARNNMYHKSFADDAVAGLVKSLKDKKSAEIWLAIYQAVFTSTALHEVGHTLGLRHNFEASTDALNFHDDYWKLRGAEGKVLDTPTKKQIDGGMNDYRYSSIMDYAGRFNTDLKGLGHYDKAAIAFGYGQLVEVFDQKVANKALGHKLFGAVRQELIFLASSTTDADGNYFGDPSYASRAFALNASLRGIMHYTSIPNVFGGVDGVKQRHWEPYQKLIDEMTAAGTKAGGKPKPAKLFEVPYRFCSDEYAEGTGTCTYYDEGVDPHEIVAGALSQWRDYYVINAFRRDRIEFYLWNYESRVRWRYFQPIAIQYQNWVFDQYDPDVFANPGILWGHLYDYRPDSGITEPYWESANNGPGIAASEAVRDGLNTLAAVLATPEPGAYCLDPDNNHYTLWTTDTSMPLCKKVESCYPAAGAEEGCADLVVPLGVGRHAWTEYDFETGYYFYDRIKYAGAYYDKAAAMETLSDPTTYFVGVDSSQPINNYILSTFIYFPRELTRIFGAISAGRDDVIGYKVVDRKLVAPNVFGDEADIKKLLPMPTVDMPNLYTLRPYAMFLGLGWLNSNWDQTFNDASKIWLDGSAEAFMPPAAATVTTYVNPINNRTYKAVHMADPKLFNVGVEMLVRAQKLADQYIAIKTKDPNDPDLDWYSYLLAEETQFIELMRGMYDLYGYAWW